MNYYKVRITSWNPKIVDLFKDHNRYIIGWEVGKTSSNEHVHIYLESPKDRGTLIKRITKLEDYQAGNKFYSFRELQVEDDDEDFIKYKAYCIKEGKYEMKGIKPEEQELIMSYDYNIKSEKKVRREQREPVWKQILKECANIQYSNDAYREIAERVVDYHSKNDTLVRRFALKSYTDTIYLKLFPQFGHYMLVKWICDD